MGSVEARPANATVLTEDTLLIGVPLVEFGVETSPGVFESYRDLGLVQSAAISKDLDVISLNSATSGIDVLILELVRRFEARLNITVSQFDVENLRLMFGAGAAAVATSAGDLPIAGEEHTLPAYAEWMDLNDTIKSTSDWTSLAPAPIAAEAVGIGDGTTGEVTGDFSLDFKIEAGDIAATVVIYEDGVNVTTALRSLTLVEGLVATTGQLALDEEPGTPIFDGGARLTYGTGEAPANGVVITADYTPGWTLTEDTDYIVDYVDSRVRRVAADAAGQKLIAGQPVDSAYTTLDQDGHTIEPYTQFTFAGRARLKLLTDVGINLIWLIPKCQVRINDDDFEFSKEEFAEGGLTITMLNDGSATPYGTMNVYEESAA